MRTGPQRKDAAAIAMAPVDPAGRLLHAQTEPDLLAVTDRDLGEAGGEQLAWGATLFGAAQDAAERVPWPRRASCGPGSWRTQGRWIALAATILGLSGLPGEAQLETGLLGVSALTRREAAAAFTAAAGYQSRGRAITLPLVDLEQAGQCVLDWLLVAGFVAMRWGLPQRWDPRSGQLRVLAPRARAP